MKHRFLILIAALFAAVSLQAEPLTLTNKQADELCGSLMKFGPGLSGANAMNVARAINVLKPLTESYGAGIKAELTLKKITATTRTDSTEFAAYVAAVEAIQAKTVTVDLPRFTITPEEADRVSSTTPPATLALVMQYLEPQPAKK
jgi:hypothetical protein